MIEKPIVFNSFTLNNQAVRKALKTTSPYYDFWVRSAVWVPGQEDANWPKPRGVGQYSGEPSYQRAWRLNLSGLLKARDLTALAAGKVAILAACADLGYHTLSYTEWGQATKNLTAKCTQQPVVEDSQDKRTVFERPFTVQFYVPDPSGIYS